MDIVNVTDMQGSKVMSVKKHKRKAVKHPHHIKKEGHPPSLLSRHPRLFLSVGLLLLVIGVLLLTIGYVSDARVGLSMLSLFFGASLVLFSNSALPKKRNKIN